MERTVKIFDKPVTVTDREESHYLSTMPESFEPDVLGLFAAACGPRTHAVDIGANIGLTAISLGRLCHAGKVVAIEASPDTFEYLKANVASAGLTNVTCVNMAASSTSGQLSITFPPSFSAGAFVNNKYQTDFAGHLHYTVPARPVDEYLDSIGMKRVDFMKIDVEGFELEVLRGARQTLARCKPVVCCEVNHWCLNIFQRLSLPDFIDGVKASCPHVFAVHSDGKYLDLSDKASLHHFYHQHVIGQAYMNLLCGFDKPQLVKQLESRASAGQCDSESRTGRWHVGRIKRSVRRIGQRLLRV